MSSEFAITVENVAKHYVMFARPEDRLKQMVVPRLERLIGRQPRRYFQDFAAVDDISFSVRRGETVGIIGRNGSGKSTMLQMICGTLQPTAGKITVNGRIAALLELGAGFNPEFTGRENVYLNAAILGLTRAETDARFDAIAGFADIGIFIDQPVKTYSSGMYVRLAFAVAINVEPDILVVDEALAVGDEAFQRKCFARIEQIRDRGATILFVSHGAQTIVQLCDRALLFDRGEMILDGRPKTVVNQYQRFINLSGEEAEPVREEIRAMDGWAARPPAVEAEAAAEGDPADAATRLSTPAETQAQAPEDDDSWYDPNLKSDSRVDYESKGARIRDVRITTLDGRQVNVLRSGKTYILEYSVDIAETAADFVCGLAIKTVNGVELGGTGTHLTSMTEEEVSPGIVLKASFRFNCILRPGVYFVNSGVGSVRSGTHISHRILDAISFRVMEDEKLRFSSIVDFGIEPHIERME
jgi:homopolymeric O-antigen transport system ATP-binding protein